MAPARSTSPVLDSSPSSLDVVADPPSVRLAPKAVTADHTGEAPISPARLQQALIEASLTAAAPRYPRAARLGFMVGMSVALWAAIIGSARLFIG